MTEKEYGSEHRRNKHYDEIIVFWCSRTENTPDQNGRNR